MEKKYKLLTNYYNAGKVELYAGEEVILDKGWDMKKDYTQISYNRVLGNGEKVDLCRVVYTKDLISVKK